MVNALFKGNATDVEKVVTCCVTALKKTVTWSSSHQVPVTTAMKKAILLVNAQGPVEITAIAVVRLVTLQGTVNKMAVMSVTNVIRLGILHVTAQVLVGRPAIPVAALVT